jgi:hypothetical protein
MTAGKFDHVRSCSDLAEADIAAAVLSLEACAALLQRFAEVSAPGAGAPAIFALFAHVGSPACAWREGALSVELFSDGDVTRIRVMEELAAGLLERVLPAVTLRAPLDELTSAIERFPAILADLRLVRPSLNCVWLVADEPAPALLPLEIDEHSMSGIPPRPDDVDTAWDDAISA